VEVQTFKVLSTLQFFCFKLVSGVVFDFAPFRPALWVFGCVLVLCFVLRLCYR